MNSAKTFNTMVGVFRLIKASHSLKPYMRLPLHTRSLFQYRPKYTFSSNTINSVSDADSKTAVKKPESSEGFNSEVILSRIINETKRLNMLSLSSEEIRKLNDPRLQELTSLVSDNLHNFNKPKEVGRSAIFILRCCPADSPAVSKLLSYLSAYDDLLLIEKPVLEQVIPYLMRVKPEGYQGVFDKFSALLKENGRRLDINDFVTLLDLWNNGLVGNQVEAGMKGVEFREFIKKQTDLFLVHLNSINSINLVRVFEFYFGMSQDAGAQKLMSAIEKKFIKNYPGFKPEQIVKLVDMLAQLESTNEDLWIRLEEEVIIKIHEFNPQQLSVILNSFSGMNIGTEDLFTEISRKISAGIELVEPMDIPFIVLNLAKSGKHVQKTFQDLYPLVMDNIQHYSPSQLVEIFWAYTITSKIDDKLYSALAENIIAKIEDLKIEDYTLAIDSLTYYKKSSSDLSMKILAKIRDYFLRTKDLSLLDANLVLSVYYYGMNVFALDEDLRDYLKSYFLWRLNNLNLADKNFIITLGPLLIQDFDKNQKVDEETIIAYGNKVKAFYQKERSANFDEKERADMSFILSDFNRVLNKFQVV